MSYLLEVPVESNAASTDTPHQESNKNMRKLAPSTGLGYDIDDGLVELMEVLESINEDKVAAKLNEVSMIDNKGGRIYY